MNSLEILKDRLDFLRLPVYTYVNNHNVTNYYNYAIRKHLPLRYIKLVKELLNTGIYQNYLIAAEILVKYDITK